MIDAVEGWTWLVNATKWHYFRGGRSLCGRWACFGQPEYEEDKPSPDNCAACWKKRQKEITHG